DVMETAELQTQSAARAMAVLYELKVGGATLNIENGSLVGIDRASIGTLRDTDLVDRTALIIGGVSTVFQKQGDDFVRMSTNVKKENGERAVGTKLATDSPAFAKVSKGEVYIGRA